MNAILTWWGISMAIVNHSVQSASIIDPKIISSVVPVFVAIMVWVIRILIIGTLSLAMDRTLHMSERRGYRRPVYNNSQPMPGTSRQAPVSQPTLAPRPTLNRSTPVVEPRYARGNNNYNQLNLSAESSSQAIPEPTYHSLNALGNPIPRSIQGDRPVTNVNRNL
jgi:hypothetical protein